MKKLIKIILLLIIPFSIKAQTGITTEGSYRTDVFLNKYKQWSIYSLDAGHIDSSYTILFRYNYQQRINLNNQIRSAKEFEFDYYPVFEKGYAWLNLAHSPDGLFAKYRGNLEIYRTLNKSLEGELGYSGVYNYSDQYISSYNASIGLYQGNTWTQLKPSAIKLPRLWAYNIKLTSRYYFESKWDYIGVVLLKGLDSERTYNIYSNEVYMGRVEIKKSLSKSIKLRTGVDFIHQYIETQFVNSIGGEVGLRIIFN